MRFFIVSFCCFLFSLVQSQDTSSSPNIFIITTDGFRWQEVFNGADDALTKDENYVVDTGLIRDQYWSDNLEERRKKLLPFFWNVISKKGQIIGNRNFNNKANVANIYKKSYPGYNEILTGEADIKFIPNLKINNTNHNLLEKINQQKNYSGKVVAFSSWNVMPYIINENRSNIYVNSGYENLEDSTEEINNIINKVQNSIENKGHTREDVLTYAAAKNFIQNKHPKIVFLGLGETDEFAHQGKYDQYLQKAHQFDQMLSELWYYVQTDPFYKNNTTFIITTDHGRGSKPHQWTQHGFWVKGSGQVWQAILGPTILPNGEIKSESTVYQKQISNMIFNILNTKSIDIGFNKYNLKRNISKHEINLNEIKKIELETVSLK